MLTFKLIDHSQTFDILIYIWFYKRPFIYSTRSKQNPEKRSHPGRVSNFLVLLASIFYPQKTGHWYRSKKWKPWL